MRTRCGEQRTRRRRDVDMPAAVTLRTAGQGAVGDPVDHQLSFCVLKDDRPPDLVR